MLAGLGAAAAAFGAAAVISAAGAPTARADALSDITAAVNGDITDGQAAISAAFADFGSNHVNNGLAALFSGLDDENVATGDNLFIGTVEALNNESITGSILFGIHDPGTFAAALTDAQGDISDGQALLNQVSTDLSTGLFGSAAFNEVIGADLLSVAPAQELLIGAAESLGL
ncbi:MAG TPA: hypothetical protein VIO95_07015 [Mycobacterium sp.]